MKIEYFSWSNNTMLGAGSHVVVGAIGAVGCDGAASGESRIGGGGVEVCKGAGEVGVVDGVEWLGNIICGKGGSESRN